MLKHSAIAWSFGKTNNSFYHLNKTPGPGAYNESQISYYKPKPPQWRLGTGKRGYSNTNQNPGPGNYNLSSSLGNAPKFTMRPKTGTSLEIMNKEIPGPGAYTPNVLKKENFSYSMRIRPESATGMMNNPGPGTYNIRKYDKDLIKAHSYVFGKDKKDKLPDFTYMKSPGPGAYNNENEAISKKTPLFSFGKEERGSKSRPYTPGPGTYEAKKVIGNDAPKISMTFKRNVPFRNENPGPGTYTLNTSQVKLKQPEYRIGTAKREIIDKETKLKPGPGTYCPDNVDFIKPNAPKWVIGKEERGNMSNSCMLNPGPGAYEYKRTVGDGPKVSKVYIKYI